MIDTVLVFVLLLASDLFVEVAELGRTCMEGFDVNHITRYRQGSRPGGHSNAYGGGAPECKATGCGME
jgi:hypothetical protein